MYEEKSIAIKYHFQRYPQNRFLKYQPWYFTTAERK